MQMECNIFLTYTRYTYNISGVVIEISTIVAKRHLYYIHLLFRYIGVSDPQML